MKKPWSRKRMLWTIVITVLATTLLVVLSLNFVTSEKALDRKVEHRYAVSDPQFRREMSVLLDFSGDAARHSRRANLDHL